MFSTSETAVHKLEEIMGWSIKFTVASISSRRSSLQVRSTPKHQ